MLEIEEIQEHPVIKEMIQFHLSRDMLNTMLIQIFQKVIWIISGEATELVQTMSKSEEELSVSLSLHNLD